MSEETKPPITSDVVTEQDKGRCAPALGSASAHDLTMAAYKDLITGPVPIHDGDYRRAIRLAVMLGRLIETNHRETQNNRTLRQPPGEADAETKMPE